MNTQKPVNSANKMKISHCLDPEVVEAINEQKPRREKRSTFINHALRVFLGLEDSE